MIPIGLQCTSAAFKNQMNKTPTMPFDWMFATPEFVYKILELMLVQKIDIQELVREHFFYCDKRSNISSQEHYYTCETGFALYNSKYNVIFPHDTYDEATIEKYIRRMSRHKDAIINMEEHLTFIYASQSSLKNGNFTIDGQNVVKDVYMNLSKIYALIRSVRKNFKMIVFDSIQEEQENDLDEQIKLIKLNKCNNWCQMLSHMKGI